ncbi:MAG: hypothetical protein ABWU84_11015 [Pyrobaculum sp.]|uniref:hypothetical protein n=1 Tax=Pyrobaculum sp. TaxID=2004705 RepID=UPI003EEC5394
MYVVYLLYAELGGGVARYVGSGEWPRKLRSHARGYSLLTTLRHTSNASCTATRDATSGYGC